MTSAVISAASAVISATLSSPEIFSYCSVLLRADASAALRGGAPFYNTQHSHN
jgi:hypothetical protein